MQQDPIISGAILKAALVILIGGALGVGAYALADGGIDLPDVNLEDLTDTTTSSDVTTIQDTTLEDTTLGEPEPAPEPEAPAKPSAPVVVLPPEAQEAQELNRCIQSAQGDPDRIFDCLDKFQP